MKKNHPNYRRKTFIKSLAFLLRASSFFKKNLGPFVKIFSFFFTIIFSILFRLTLPFYKIYLLLKRFFKKFYSPFLSKHKILHPFSRRYLVHVMVIAISLFVVTANLNAHEVKNDELQYSNVLIALASKDALGSIIEEDSLKPQPNKITRYLGTSGVESKPSTQTSGTFIDIQAGAVSYGALVKPIISPTEAEQRRRDKVVFHIIEQGETISEIAEQYGVSVNTVLWENELTAYSIIRPGKQLAILPTSGLQYKVKSGDTIQKIAKDYKTDPESIIEFNRLASADDIRTGESLLIPGGIKPPPPRRYTIRNLTAPKPQPIAQSSGKLSWPATCNHITQYFNTWRHKGVDIACPFGTPVKASEGGTIIKARGGWNGGYGLVVIVDHGNKQTLYAHLSNIYVQVGDRVETGQALGAMGSTGRSTGSHVHLEVIVGGRQLNPLTYL
jgi:LysM repeat protein